MVTKNVNIKVLVVDDDPVNLEILEHSLKKEGYTTTTSPDGEDAWEKLEKTPEDYDIILLDKMMPKMDGMEVLARMQKHPILREVPVILQTGDIGEKEARDGIIAGAYYYLTKPFNPDMMLAIVNSATRNFVLQNMAAKETNQDKALASLICEGIFQVKTIKEATVLASALANSAEKSHEVNITLLELMINAIEHGNLNIGYETKKNLFIARQLDEEIERRMQLPENKDKVVSVRVSGHGDELKVTISDEGQGFNWNKFMDFEPIRLIEPNGRSIAIINHLMDVNLQYFEPGNKVMCQFKRKK